HAGVGDAYADTIAGGSGGQCDLPTGVGGVDCIVDQVAEGTVDQFQVGIDGQCLLAVDGQRDAGRFGLGAEFAGDIVDQFAQREAFHVQSVFGDIYARQQG